MTPKKRLIRRGQVSIENQILIAVVLVVMVVSLIAVMNILRPHLQKRGYVGFSQLIPTDWAISTTGKVYVNFRSESGSPLAVFENGVNYTFPGRLYCDLGPVLPPGTDNITLLPGQRYIFEVDCPRLGDEYDVGEEFEMDAVINYTNKATKTAHNSVGKIYGLVENVPPGWTPPTTTDTTVTTIPQCFNTPCNKTGEMDPLNCQKITYQGVEGLCTYCPQSPAWFPDGIRRCWYNGYCGSSCSSKNDCGLNEFLNLCTECLGGVCQEQPPYQTCGPCPPFDAGSLNSSWCNETMCPLCYHEWKQTGPSPGQGEDSYLCIPPEDCGQPCSNLVYDDCSECQDKCVHCEENPAVPGSGRCATGDCDRRCGPGAPIPECEVGCAWCNVTSFTCQQGDCCKPCGPLNPSQQCALGCDTCFDGYCVKAEIGVTIFVHNGTNGKIVGPNEPIEVDVAGNSNAGVSRLLISNGTLVSAFITNCTDLALERNWLGEITDPYNDQWLDDHGIDWISEYTCMPPDAEECKNYPPGLITSEENVGRYCFFALAQKYSPAGDGKWSLLASDHIQVGHIWVYLVYPQPI
ncbi:MAG: hypothetical protein V1875_03530 [Candidatus Altiarchaeota archaeon]